MNRIGLFVDVQNIYYTTRQAFGRQFNYRKLWSDLAASGQIVVANAYTTDRGDSGQQKFQAALTHIGFNVKLKPFIQRKDGSAKGDWDVGIVIDVLDAASDLDTVVLLSGDGDFDLLLHKLRQDSSVHTAVYGVRELTAKLLIDAADEYVAIETQHLL